MSAYKAFKPHESTQWMKAWEILVKKWIITEEVLIEALRLQEVYKAKNIELKIGEILAIIWENRTKIIKELNKHWVNLRIGEIMLFRWLINEEQFKDIRARITKIKKEDSKNPITFWELALELWYVDEKIFYHFLEEVWIPLKTWEKLIKAWLVTRKLVNLILSAPEHNWKRILDALLDEWSITKKQYDDFKSKMRDQHTIPFDISDLELIPNNNWLTWGKIR